MSGKACRRQARETGFFRFAMGELSGFCLEPSPWRALLLGYAAVPIPAIQEGVRRLATVLAHATSLQRC